MLDITTTKFTNDCTGHNNYGATSAMQEWRLSDGGGFASVLFAITGYSSNLGRVHFYPLSSASGNINVESRTELHWTKRDGTTDSEVGTWTAGTNFPTSNILTATNGGPLLNLANNYKDLYFGGIEQTAATLKAYMDDKYGNHAGYYYELVNGGSMVRDINNRLSNFDNGTSNYGTCPDYNESAFAPSDGWSFTGPIYYAAPDLDSNAALCAFLIFGETISPEKLIFDVYVDGVIGEKGPQMVVKFRNNNADSLLAPSAITPRIWGWPVPEPDTPALVSDPPVVTVEGVRVPNEDDANHSRTQYSASFEFTGQFSSPYVSLSDSMINWRPNGDQIAYYGIDKICDSIRLYLRFDYEAENLGDTWGDLWYVDIPYEYQGAAYIVPAMVSDSAYNKQFDTEVNVIGGLPPTDPEPDDDEPEGGEDPEGTPSGDGPYAPDGYEDLSDGEPSGFDGDAVLTTTYSMPKLTMQSVGADLWSNTYFNVLKIQTNPIENIIACKWYPMSISGTPNTPIKIGDVTLGVSADKIGTMYTKTFGTYTHTTKTTRPGYLSMTPYCIVKLHLPYVGVVQLDATEIYKRALTGKYIVDLITGDVLVMLYLDGNPYMTLTGKMGVDIPLTSTNRVQTELAAASRTLSAVIGGTGHLMAGDTLGAAGAAASGIMSIMGMDYSSQRCTSHSPACCTYENLWIFIEVQYNPSKVSAGYKTQRGFPAHLYQTLSYMASQGGGFIQLDGRTVINVAMTEEENRMLEQIMTTGFYM